MYGSWLEELVVLGTVSYSSLSLHESRMRVFRCLFSRKAGEDKLRLLGHWVSRQAPHTVTTHSRLTQSFPLCSRKVVGIS